MPSIALPSRLLMAALIAAGELLWAAAPAHAENKPAADPTSFLPSADLQGLDDGQLRWLRELLSQYPSACGKPHSLATSLAQDPSCRRSQFAGRYLTRLLKAGLMKSECEEAYEKRFVTAEKYTFDLSEAPWRGSANALVTLCEFSDFECPHCRSLGPILDRIIDELRGKGRVYFKHFPISRLHDNSTEAAAAATAAGKQGKFWQMHDLLFKNQEHLGKAELERYAGELKLDLKKWKADLPAARTRVEKDRAEGDRLEIQGTPTLFINGRKYTGPLRYDEVKDWVEEALAR